MSLIVGRQTAILLGPATYDNVIPGTSAWLNLCNISAGAEISDEATIKSVDVYCAQYQVQRIISTKYSIKLKAMVDLTTGRVTATTVTVPGSGYTSAPTVTPTGGTPTTAATFVAVIRGGVLDRVVVTTPGAGYVSAPTLAFAGGGGTLAAATTSINQISSKQLLDILKGYDYLNWYFYPRGLTTGYEGYNGIITRPKIGIKLSESDFCMLEIEGQGSGDYTQVTAP